MNFDYNDCCRKDIIAEENDHFGTVLWALWLITGYTMGGVLHALLVIAIVVVLVQFFKNGDEYNHLNLTGQGMVHTAFA